MLTDTICSVYENPLVQSAFCTGEGFQVPMQTGLAWDRVCLLTSVSFLLTCPEPDEGVLWTHELQSPGRREAGQVCAHGWAGTGPGSSCVLRSQELQFWESQHRVPGLRRGPNECVKQAPGHCKILDPAHPDLHTSST